MAADLDTRLRNALRLPAEPGATDDTRAAVLAALPRYRARRRIAAAGVGASVLAALVLGLVAITGTSRPGPGLTAAGSHRGSATSASGPSCVEVRIGTGPLACDGVPAAVSSPNNSPAIAGPAQLQFGAAVPSSAAAGLQAAPGRAVEVSLPATATTWTRVSVLSGERVVRDVTRIRRVSGRAVAAIGALPRGTYVITALGVARCPPGAFCPALPAQERWTVTLTVG